MNDDSISISATCCSSNPYRVPAAAPRVRTMQALYLKTNNSVALPIFNSLPEAQKIDAGTGKGKIAEIAA